MTYLVSFVFQSVLVSFICFFNAIASFCKRLQTSKTSNSSSSYLKQYFSINLYSRFGDVKKHLAINISSSSSKKIKPCSSKNSFSSSSFALIASPSVIVCLTHARMFSTFLRLLPVLNHSPTE